MDTAEDRFKWYDLFWRYVNRGTYQAFIKQLQKGKTDSEIDEINLSIRQVYIDKIRLDFPEFGTITLADDHSTLILEDDSSIRQIEPTFVRLMVGNHGPYIEFTEPKRKGYFLSKHLQYNYYCRYNKNLYEQFKTVNYADYKVGMWYLALYSAFDKTILNEEDYKVYQITKS